MWPFNHPLESQEDAQAFLRDYDCFLWREFAPTLAEAGLDPTDYRTGAENRDIQLAWEDRKLEALPFWVAHLNTTLLSSETSPLEALRLVQVVSGDEVFHAQCHHGLTLHEQFMVQHHFQTLKKALLEEGSVGHRLMRHMENAFRANNPSGEGLPLFLDMPHRSLEFFADPKFHARRKQGLAVKRQVALNDTLPEPTPGPTRPRM